MKATGLLPSALVLTALLTGCGETTATDPAGGGSTGADPTGDVDTWLRAVCGPGAEISDRPPGEPDYGYDDVRRAGGGAVDSAVCPVDNEGAYGEATWYVLAAVYDASPGEDLVNFADATISGDGYHPLLAAKDLGDGRWAVVYGGVFADRSTLLDPLEDEGFVLDADQDGYI